MITGDRYKVLPSRDRMKSRCDGITSSLKDLVLNFDATDYRVHGRQEAQFFLRNYHRNCVLPLYVPVPGG